MTFTYKKVLILGATSGIGKALAEAMLKNSAAKVIITGRRQDRLDQFVAENGNESRVFTFALDMGRLDKIEGYFKDLKQAHPDIDMIIHNAGIQRIAHWYEPASIDLDALTSEIILNYTSVLYTLKYGLPLLFAHKDSAAPGEKNTAIAVVTSALALHPFTLYNTYCATKAAVHHLVYPLREQLRATNVKVIELVPPSTKTELSSIENQPELKNVTFQFPALTIDEYIRDTWVGLEAGDETVAVGTAKTRFDAIEPARYEWFKRVDDHVKDAPCYPTDRAK